MTPNGLQPVGAASQPPVARKSGHFSCLDALGKGTYGICYKVVHKGGGSPCVMKVVPLSGLSNKDIKAAFSEAMLLRTVKHPHVVGYHDAWVENSHLYIVMDYCSEGDLAVLLKACTVTCEAVWGFARDISCGLEHLHTNNIMHRDIKPSNLFMSNGKVVIGDLGLGRHLEQHSLAHTQVGTPLYSAPEVCQGKPYTFSADVWAFGCALYEMIAGVPPYIAVNQVALAEKICGNAPPPLPGTCPPPLQHLILSALQKVPSQRPTMLQCLQFVSSLPLHPRPASPVAKPHHHRGQIRHRLVPSTADDLFPGPGASITEYTAPVVPPSPRQIAPESPKLNAVQVIVDRLEAQNSPEQLQRPSQPVLQSPRPTVVTSMPQVDPGTASCTSAIHRIMPESPLRQLNVRGPDTVGAVATFESEDAAVQLENGLNRCIATGDGLTCSSSCTACRETKHELKTLACKVAGLQRLLASANQRAEDEKRSRALLQRHRDRLQAVICEHGIPGVEWLMLRSPVQSPAGEARGISPQAVVPAPLAPTSAPAVSDHPPMAAKSADSPKSSALSQFQAACAALRPTTQHAESGSTSSPLALCAAIACESSTTGHMGKPAAIAESSAASAIQTKRPAQPVPVAGFAGNQVGTRNISQVSVRNPMTAADSRAATGSKLWAVPLQTPQRSAQHARAHVATPVDLQKLLQGGAEGHTQAATPRNATAGSILADMRLIKGSTVLGCGAGRTEQLAAQVTGQPNVVGGMVVSNDQSSTPQSAKAGKDKSSLVTFGVPDTSRTGYTERGAIAQAHWLQSGRVAGGATVEKSAERMHKQPVAVISSEAIAGPPAGIGPLTAGCSDGIGLSARNGAKEGCLGLGAAGRLGVGACIPAPEGAGSLTVQQSNAGNTSTAGCTVAARVQLDPGGTVPGARTTLQQDRVHHNAGAAMQQQQQRAAVQSLWLWAGQPEAAPRLAHEPAAILSEQENIAPEDGWQQLQQRHERPHSRTIEHVALAAPQPQAVHSHDRVPTATPARPPDRAAQCPQRPDCGVQAGTSAVLSPGGSSEPCGRAARRASQPSLDALYAGVSAPQTPSGRSKAMACYTATPRSPRTPRRRAPNPSRVAVKQDSAAGGQSFHAGTSASRNPSALRGLGAAGHAQVQAAAVPHGSSHQGHYGTPLPRKPRDAGAGTPGTHAAELTPVRPQSVRVGGALMRTPPTVKARAHTTAGAGDLRNHPGRPVVAVGSREKLNEAFRRTSALLQRCKGSGDDAGDAREKMQKVPLMAPGKRLSTGVASIVP